MNSTNNVSSEVNKLQENVSLEVSNLQGEEGKFLSEVNKLKGEYLSSNLNEVWTIDVTSISSFRKV